MQELDATRRAAILRGETPPPLPEEGAENDKRKADGREGHDRKRRKLAGEDDTERDIRLATSAAAPKEDANNDAKLLKLRKPGSDAPLTDHAGNINLFPVDLREAKKREKNEEAEKEKRKKEKALEDQYTMRFSNAAGRGGLEQPWYAAGGSKTAENHDALLGYQNKDVWGNEDPRRKERDQARITSNDPFAFMQKAQTQLKKSRDDKKKWAEERDRELRELRAAQERKSRRERHGKRKGRHKEEPGESLSLDRQRERDRSSKHKRRHRSRSRSPEKLLEHKSSHRRERKRSRSWTSGGDGQHERKSSHRHERERADGLYERKTERSPIHLSEGYQARAAEGGRRMV